MELAYNRPFQHVNDPKVGFWLSSSSRQSVHWHELADAVRRCYDVDRQGDACGPSSIWPPDLRNLRPWRKQPAVLFFFYTWLIMRCYKTKAIRCVCHRSLATSINPLATNTPVEKWNSTLFAWQRPVKPQTSSMSSTRLRAIVNLSLLVRLVLHLPGK